MNVTPTAATIKDNQCEASFGIGSAPVKIEEAREYGFMKFLISNNKGAYIGLYRQSGATYVWYDGSVGADLPWSTGSPPAQPTNDLVYVTGDCVVKDGDGSDTQTLPCKTPATYVGYDPTAKFL
ncbi:hypothetical protein AAVH_40233 [Aphelenchoides avenae]|nr:hypothetical protein AAVH_40233 [Aphelenchus avenae]